MATKAIQSPVGQLSAFVSDGNLVALAFPANVASVTRQLERQGLKARKKFTDAKDESVLVEVARQLDLYFSGKLSHFHLPVRTGGTAFQEEIWKALREIPWGATTTYGDLARKLRRPGAARAIGMANARNPIAIIIPCHRVTGAGNKIKGFAGGSAAVRGLLAIERKPKGLP